MSNEYILYRSGLAGGYLMYPLMSKEVSERRRIRRNQTSVKQRKVMCVFLPMVSYRLVIDTIPFKHATIVKREHEQ